MARAIDIAGQRFGRLTALERAGNNSHGAALWECLCHCGRHFKATGYAVRTGHTTSCGCSCPRTALPAGEAAFRQILVQYKRQAKKRNLDFSLSEDQFRSLITANCSYCGSLPVQIWKKKTGDFRYNGIDRVENLNGYVPGNCVAACGPCNEMKSSRSLVEFLSKVESIYKKRLKP